MLLSLTIALLAGLPGLLLQMAISKAQYITVSFFCLMCACLLTFYSLPSYCKVMCVLAFSLIYLVYMLMLLLKCKKRR